MKQTQKQLVKKVLQDADGGWVSTRYFKQTLLISEVNGRLSELKNEGFEVETSDFRDEYGFAFHRIKKKEPEQMALI